MTPEFQINEHTTALCVAANEWAHWVRQRKALPMYRDEVDHEGREGGRQWECEFDERKQ